MKNKVTDLSGKTVVITGGAGFIGSHVVKLLLQKDIKVIVVDIELKKNSFFLREKLHKQSILEICDVRDRKGIFEIFRKYMPDYVIHFAATTLVTDAYALPHDAIETNVMGTVNILEAVRTISKSKGVLVASSDKAYGKTTVKYTENTALKGDHPYDVSKSSADLISQAYFKTYNLPVVVTRFGNVYGEGDIHFERLIPGICEAVIKNKPLMIRSDGKFVRDYVYVKDIANGCLHLLERIVEVKGEAFNFSSEDNLTVLKTIAIAEKILNRKILYKILNNTKNEIPYQHLDDSKVRELGWKNTHTLDSTMRGILQWYETIL
jgi:CDP-glucose 4,6-dehydratase